MAQQLLREAQVLALRQQAGRGGMSHIVKM